MIKQDMIKLVAMLLQLHLKLMIQRQDRDKLSNFLDTLFQIQALSAVRHKTVAFVMELVADHLQEHVASKEAQQVVAVVMKKELFWQAAESLSYLMSLGYVLPSYQDRTVKAFAIILSCCEPQSVVDAHTILNILKTIPTPFLVVDNDDN